MSDVPVVSIVMGSKSDLEAMSEAGAVNAALLAVAMLALSDKALALKLKEHRAKMRREVEASDNELELGRRR